MSKAATSRLTITRSALIAGCLLAIAGSALAQTPPPSVAPTVIPLYGELRTADGQPRTGTVMLVVSLYDGKDDPTPRWTEEQFVTLDAQGRYSVQFGATRPEGLPMELFTGAPGARYVGVAVAGEPEQPRMPIVTVPYAAKAASAETLDGKPASEFALASTVKQEVKAALDDEATTREVTTRATTTGYIPKYSNDAGGTENSSLFEFNGKIGLGSTSPVEKLEVLSDSLHSFGFGTATAGRVGLLGWLNTAASPVPGLFSNSASYRLALGANRSEHMSITPNGRVGIGSTSPAEKLEILSDSEHALGFGTATAGRVGLLGWLNTAAAPVPGLFSHSASYRLALGANRTEHMSITPQGRVGIGTTGPNALLQLQSSTLNGEMMILRNTNTTASASVPMFIASDSGGTLTNVSIENGGTGSFVVRTGATSEAGYGSARLTVLSGGNVGIGTMTPSSKLHVAGDARITGDITVDGNIAAKYQDVAEWVDAVGALGPGTVVTIDPTATNRVRAAARAYDTAVAGAISPQPGVVLGEPGEGRVLVAQSGRVRLKADARNGAIRPGDLLVTSPTPGHVMRAKRSLARPGTIVGKALEALPSGRGQILVLLTLQ